jgi:hypothetical protein
LLDIQQLFLPFYTDLLRQERFVFGGGLFRWLEGEGLKLLGRWGKFAALGVDFDHVFIGFLYGVFPLMRRGSLLDLFRLDTPRELHNKNIGRFILFRSSSIFS